MPERTPGRVPAARAPERPRILVTGIGGPAGRALLRQLPGRGYEVVGVDMAPVDLPGVRVDRVPPADDPRFVATLYAVAERERAALVLPTVSEELVVLARQTRLPAGSGPRLVLAPADAVATANDKFLLSRRLAAAGVPVPRFALPSQAGGADLDGPVVSKPRVGRGGRGVRVYPSVRAPEVRELADDQVLQEFVPGVEYAPNLYVGRAEPVVVVLEKTRLANGRVGNAVGVRRVSAGAAADVREVALAAVRAIGLTGPVDIDIRRRADGTPVVLDVNARFGANSASAPEVLAALLAEHGARAAQRVAVAD